MIMLAYVYVSTLNGQIMFCGVVYLPTNIYISQCIYIMLTLNTLF